MKIPALFKEYIWLIETIHRYGRITFAELGELWKEREENAGAEFSRTTFNRYRDSILDMFGVIIDCDRHDCYRYFIANKEVLQEDSVQNWLFSTMSVNNMLDENMALHNRILLESIPSGDNDTLQMVIKAMRDNRRIKLTYRRYGSDAASTISAAPYCLKLFRRRWYVLVTVKTTHHKHGKRINDESFAIYSLDRIESIELEDTKFTIAPDFDAAAFFDECFGVVVGDGSKPVRVVLRAYGMEQHYLRDLPLHHSQKILKEAKDHTDFELFLRPTTDFKAHLMARGSWLQVIKPISLAREMLNWHEDAIERYKKSLKIEKK